MTSLYEAPGSASEKQFRDDLFLSLKINELCSKIPRVSYDFLYFISRECKMMQKKKNKINVK
jgi:hypothetical protein